MNYQTLETVQGYRTSQRYSVVNTGNLIQLLQAETGYELAGYQEARCYKSEKQGFQKHLARLRTLSRDSEIAPEIVIHNSYDKTSALKIMVGFFRFTCANGLIVGSAIDSFQTYHSSIDYDALSNWCAGLSNRIEKGLEQVEIMQSKTMPIIDTLPIAHKALQILNKNRFEGDLDDVLSSQNKARAFASLTSARREADFGDTVWQRFNVMQETFTKGGSGIRAVKSIDKIVKINRVLWDEFAQYAN